jgi:single stranded DNA-binding protein
MVSELKRQETMASFNKVILVGNVTRDIELRQIGSGSSVCDLGLAVNDRKKTQSGTRQQRLLLSTLERDLRF